MLICLKFRLVAIEVKPYATLPCRDTYVRIYDADKNTVKGKYQHRAPVLDAAFVDEGKVASGGLDQSIKLFDIETGRESVLGAHSAPVRCVEHAPAQSEFSCQLTFPFAF